MQSPVVATKFHCTKSAIYSTGHCKKRTTIFHFKFTRSSTFRIQRFNLACHNRNPENHLVSPWSSAIFPRGIRNCTECINVSWRWVSQVWNALKLLDASDVDNPKASSGIVEIYSLRVVPKSLAGKPDGWNREHLWPRSYGLKDGSSLTDLHNIRPADVNVNSSRGNKYYGECNVYSTKCLKPANKEAALDTETDKDRWAPPKQHRGDIARALMYMAVCYGFRQPDGGPALHLSDSPKSSATSEMGLLSTLLKWNEIDPPSREEKLRNERVCKFYQHNRNPFVDHPEYASLIWEEHSSLRLPRSHEIHNKRQFKTRKHEQPILS